MDRILHKEFESGNKFSAYSLLRQQDAENFALEINFRRKAKNDD